MPTRPLWPATLWSIHSMESQASVPSSMLLGSRRSRTGRCITNWPSEAKRPRISWKAKI